MCHRIFSVIFTIFGSFIFVESAFYQFRNSQSIKTLCDYLLRIIVFRKISSTPLQCVGLLEYLQSSREGGRSQERVAASMTVRGMETANRRSDSAREEMKMLRAVLSSGRHTAASITARLPGTAECYWCYWISGMYFYFGEFSLKMFNLENKSFAFAQQMLYKCAVYGIASLNVNMLNKP